MIRIQELCSFEQMCWKPSESPWRKVVLGKTELEQDKESRADKEMDARQIGYNDSNLGSFIFLFTLGYVFKSFREVKFYCTSVQSLALCQEAQPLAGRMKRARGWEASRRGLERDCWCLALSGWLWEVLGPHSQGQGDRYLMAFLGVSVPEGRDAI